MTKRRRTKVSVDVIVLVSTMFAATIITLTGFRSIGTAQGQGNFTLTPEQKSGMCDPNDKFINSSESKICGKPVTTSNTTISGATTNNTTPGTEAPGVIPST